LEKGCREVGEAIKNKINKEEKFNPIKQDIKDGKLRFVDYKNGYIWNYGTFPQTWEDGNHIYADTQAKGDNDPLDVCEIGSAVGKVGQIKQVKVLGTIALIDEGETDWKIIAIDVNDPLAAKLNDITDVDKDLLDQTREWFRDYKTVVGKPQNKFAYDAQYKNREFALIIIKENHAFWQKLISGASQCKGVSLERATQSQ